MTAPPGDYEWDADEDLSFGTMTEAELAAWRHSREPNERGAYEKRIAHDGREYVTGLCAGCGFLVTARHLYAIRHSTDGTPGGIFHDMPGTPEACAPTGPQWYGLGEGE